MQTKSFTRQLVEALGRNTPAFRPQQSGVTGQRADALTAPTLTASDPSDLHRGDQPIDLGDIPVERQDLRKDGHHGPGLNGVRDPVFVPPPPPYPHHILGNSGGSRSWMVAVAVLVIPVVIASSFVLGTRNPFDGAQPTSVHTLGIGPPSTLFPSDQQSSVSPPTNIDPSGVFTAAYRQQNLIFHSPGPCDGNLYVDLDEPRVGVTSQEADLELSQECIGKDRLLLSYAGSTVAIAPNSNVTPNDCAELIRTGALSSNQSVPVELGTVLCLVTNRQAAEVEGITQKIVRIHITAVAKGTVSATAFAWNVPD
jgi:hypothetical protein